MHEKRHQMRLYYKMNFKRSRKHSKAPSLTHGRPAFTTWSLAVLVHHQLLHWCVPVPAE
jgi:hypothetical protein